MELVVKEYKRKEKSLSFTIKEKEINGLTGNHLEEILKIIKLNGEHNNQIEINHEKVKEKNRYEVKKKIIVIEEEWQEKSFGNTLEEIMIDQMKEYEIYPKNLEKKLKDSLKIVGLEPTLLTREFATLSQSEKKKFQISLGLLLNPEMIILIEPFKVLDQKNRKKLMMVMKKIKENFQKTIVIVSNDPNILYEETDHLIIYKNDKILVEGKTKELYQRVEFLKRHKVELPEIIEFIYYARKNKNAKIDYCVDIRDLIKDIYKHV